jgi:hypothetical protein
LTLASAALAEPAPPLLVWLDTHGEPFDQARLQTSLEQELGRDVRFTQDAALAGVKVRLDGQAHADVEYRTPTGEKLSRQVELPADRERSAQVVSWLTVNLVRDEAAELLDELRSRREAEAAADKAAADKAAADKADADKAAADKAAADKAAADKAAADKAAADKAAADKAAAQIGARDELLRDPLHSFDVAFATPISLLHDSPRRELRLQLALAYGDSGAISGVGMAPGVLRIRRDLQGAALGAGAVLVGGNARGAMLAVGGVIAGGTTGVLLGVGFASAASLRGVGGSAGATVVRGKSEGVLLAAGFNWSAGHRGLEMAAGVNAASELEGLAIAPVNVHRRVHGLQVGVVNVAEEVDGGAIGVLSFAKNGRVQPVLWTATDGSLHVAVKSIAGVVFTQLGGGIDLDAATFSYEGGAGLHLRLGAGFFFEPGVHYAALLDTADGSGAPDEQQLHYLAQLGWRAGNQLDLLAAAGVRHTFAGGSGAAWAPEARLGIGFF